MMTLVCKYATNDYLSLADASANYSGACDVYDKLAEGIIMSLTNLVYLKNSSLLHIYHCYQLLISEMLQNSPSSQSVLTKRS